ncbi:hypothetical protein [Methanoregula sp.]|uniref:hypothetical protein n=1 Tax=Methanoregula sp. TaxID=2052170 RepID=UPI003C1B5154
MVRPPLRLVTLLMLALILSAAAIAGCVRNTAPVPGQSGTEIPVSAAVTVEPESTPAPVPAMYQDTYDSLKTDMDQYYATLSARDTGSRYPVLFGAELLQANVNRGDALLQPQVMDSVRLTLDRYKAMGIQGVTIPIHYPVYTPGYPRYNEYAAFYRQVAAEVHERGMVLDVENHILFANTEFSPVKWDYSGVTFDQYKQEKRAMVEAIINDTHPEFLDISAEPDTEYALTRWSFVQTPAQHTELINYVLAGLDRKGTKIGAGAGTWDPACVNYAKSYAANTDLDFITIHVYPIYGNGLSGIDTISAVAHQYNKSVVIDEAWLHKQAAPLATFNGMTTSSQAYGLDIFSFWSPLDQHFLSTLAESAKVNHIDYISPFWGTYFFGYTDYSPAIDALGYNGRANAVNTIASAHIRDGTLSPTGEFYQQLIGNTS